jgi:hypothetical protein
MKILIPERKPGRPAVDGAGETDRDQQREDEAGRADRHGPPDPGLGVVREPLVNGEDGV